MFIRLHAVAALAVAGILVMAVSGALGQYLWHNRIVLVFASAADGALAEQRRLLDADRPGLAERDVVALAVVGDTIEPLVGAPPSRADARGLRERFLGDAGQAFHVMLIGKDGGLKWGSDQPATTSTLFGLIDAMPMRRNEAAAK